MKALIFTLLLFSGSAISFQSFSQAKMGQICFIRAHGYVGSLVNDKVYIDDSLACKLKNNQYSLHSVPIGKHTVSADGTGLSMQKRSEPFTITVEEGKISYVDVVWANTVSCQEITENSAKVKLKKLKWNKQCSTASH